MIFPTCLLFTQRDVSAENVFISLMVCSVNFLSGNIHKLTRRCVYLLGGATSMSRVYACIVGRIGQADGGCK